MLWCQSKSQTTFLTYFHNSQYSYVDLGSLCTLQRCSSGRNLKSKMNKHTFSSILCFITMIKCRFSFACLLLLFFGSVRYVMHARVCLLFSQCFVFFFSEKNIQIQIGITGNITGIPFYLTGFWFKFIFKCNVWLNEDV